MNRKSLFGTLLLAAALLAAACGSGRYVSADSDLESIYMGKSYYDIVDEFGRPDGSFHDDEGGTRILYNGASLNGTSAARLYRQFAIRNRNTKEAGTPTGGIVFAFNARMKCYAVESDFQIDTKAQRRSQVSEPKSRRPAWSTPKVPRDLEYPFVKRRSPYAKVVSIEKIEVQRDYTKVYFSYCDRTPNHRPLHDKGLAINADVFIRDCETGQRMKLIETEGISLYPEYTDFAHNRGGYDMLVYALVFEALPLDTQTIDIVEPGPEGFNFYEVDVRTPLNFDQTKMVNPIP
ncbi:MAG: hypothetical protein IJ745_02350 [Bacteroidales bacterium]|nr:hypothetical protein [Bacteroidales bacterium]